jgi:pimeloyl-ACP methyl ester carboxylesterase
LIYRALGRKLLIFFALVAALVVVVQWRAGVRESTANAAYPPDGQIVTIDGVDIHVIVEGTGPDLVLIHGASGNTRDLTFDFAKRLTDRYRVIIFDRPGLGWSTRPPAYTGAWNNRSEPPKVQAELLQKAADQIGVTNPLVMGHSYGGAVALAWGLLRPDETAGLILVAAASNPWPGDLGLLYNVNSSRLGGALFIPLITAFTPRSTLEQTIESIFEPQPAPDAYLDYVGAGLTLRRHSMRANAQQVNSLRPYIVEMAEEYPGLTLPVEIVHGDADTIVPLVVHSEPLSKLIATSNLTVLEGIGHMPHHVAPKPVVDAIDRTAARAGLR